MQFVLAQASYTMEYDAARARRLAINSVPKRTIGAATLAAALCCSPALAAEPTQAVAVTGAVQRPNTYALAELQGLPVHTMRVSYQTRRGPVQATYTGATLWSVLEHAGLAVPPGTRDPGVRLAVVARGSDGYAVTLSGAELDPRFASGREPVLVAYAQAGPDGGVVPLGSDGFARLVVPGDAAGGRYVANLAGLHVVDLATPPLPVGSIGMDQQDTGAKL